MIFLCKLYPNLRPDVFRRRLSAPIDDSDDPLVVDEVMVTMISLYLHNKMQEELENKEMENKRQGSKSQGHLE
jgi:hypothetical protein